MTASKARREADQVLGGNTPPGHGETERLRALHGYDILDTLPEPAFDELAQLAAEIVGTPVALISLVDEHRLWFKSRLGFDAQEMPREESFCSYAIIQGEEPRLMIVPDASRDPRFIDNPLVRDEPHIRFYAGAPLVSPDRHMLGTLCVIDKQPRVLSPTQEQALMILSRQVVGQMELRQALRRQSALLREREQAHAALAKVQEHLSAVIQAEPECVSLIRADGVLLEMNPAGLEMFEAERPEQLLGKPMVSFLAPEFQEDFQAFHHRVCAGERGRLTFDIVGLKGTRRSMETHAAPLRQGPAGELAHLAITRDVTEQRELQAQLSLAERMATVGTLAAGVAHEINNPLSYMLSNLRFALESLENHPLSQDEEGQEVFRALQEAEEGTQRVRLIVREMKTFSRGDEESLGPLDLHKPLESALMMASNDIHHHARLIRDYGDVPEVQANEARLAQVFLNLLVNAVQALPSEDVDRNEIRIVTRTSGPGQVVVEVSDNGAGIPPQLQTRIFEPFFTTKPIGQGTGLGLSVCHRIITQLKGSIEVDSAPGRGTTFRIFLPVARS